MLTAPSGRRSPRTRDKLGLDRWSVVRAIVLGLLMAVVISAVLLIDFLPSNQVILDAGDVSPDDILAPADLTYESTIRTRQAQEAQAAAVSEIYEPPDASVARQQEFRARQILDYISTVRQDAYAPPQQKAAWIAAIPDLDLPANVISQTVTLAENDWQQVREETVRVLVRAMQDEIRESQLPDVRRTLPTLVSTSLSDDQADVVEAIAGDLVTANTFYDAARTEEARQQARDNTPPVSQSYQRGEAIVRTGSLVRATDIEALEQFGLRQQATRWEAVVGTGIFALIVSILVGLFILRLQPSLWQKNRTSIVAFLLVAVFVIGSKFMLPISGGVVPYFYPLATLSMLITILFGPALGLAFGVSVGLVGIFVLKGSLEMSTYLLAGTLMGALALGQAERLRAFLRAGLAVALTNAAVLVLFGLLTPDQDLVRVTINALLGIVAGGMAVSLTLAAFFGLSALLDVVTPFQLMELSRPTHPLVRRLLLQAPGTYHHTLLVSNMAEEAASRIGADGLLARVGAYYHDIGKTMRPYFFAENRVGNVNPHERLDPRTSAQIIISHVQDGLDLAAKYRLPSAIRAFIPEHQGVGLTLAFYRMAVQQAQEAGEDPASVRKEDFAYPGPRPQSRETAIVMLADSCEARIRSAQPKSAQEIDRLIRDTIKAKMDEGQLAESDVTLRDLEEIRKAFLSVLQGVFHPRVKYPEPVKIRQADGQQVEI